MKNFQQLKFSNEKSWVQSKISSKQEENMSISNSSAYKRDQVFDFLQFIYPIRWKLS